tara:strand:+ start:241 stop:474 length:234 start_codon:yes stop_codon:yes gene_type:complete
MTIKKEKKIRETYDQNGNPIYKYPARHFPYENQRKELAEYFYHLNGNGWWWFADYKQTVMSKKSWINKYNPNNGKEK